VIEPISNTVFRSDRPVVAQALPAPRHEALAARPSLRTLHADAALLHLDTSSEDLADHVVVINLERSRRPGDRRRADPDTNALRFSIFPPSRNSCAA